ncbi:hypothetical protein BB561_005742 [Smittium simulii]|uniref:Mitochondrial carrier n=1 Tax=Smittium simulii TaxID=133385 RepID=A0A2T9Y8N5_9FUNG|nr:hypothetical protein BB561_005742 [Smittium simulii]
MDSHTETVTSKLTDEALASFSPQDSTAITIPPKISPLWDLCFGSLAGMNGKFIEYPFDTVKVRMQTMDKQVFNGTLDCLGQTWKNEGFKGFYRGLSSPLFGAMIENAFIFFAYKKIQHFVSYTTGAEQKKSLSIQQLALCGGVSGGMASILLTPIELVKCKLQVENVKNYSGVGANAGVSKYNGPFSVIKSIIKTDGLKGIFKGFSPTLFRESIGTALWFGTYEMMCLNYLQMKSEELKKTTANPPKLTKTDIGPIVLILAGGTAGVVYNFCTFPIDVIKSRLQTLDVVAAQASSSMTIPEIISNVYRSGGIPAFYRGLGVTLLRAFPANATMFLTFEYLSRLVTNLHS